MRKLRVQFFLAALLVTMLIAAAGAQCPSYVHKNNVILGSPSALPDGFFVYGVEKQRGVYKSSIRAFDARVIPNTENDEAQSIEISDDGKWIIYRTPDAKVYLIGGDGNKKTVVPVAGADAGLPTYVGFYRRSPYGGEIFCAVSQGRVDAVRVDFSKGTPAFGAQRTILSTGGRYFLSDWDLQMAVVGDELVIRGGERGDRITYYTIPNGGRGTAGTSDQFAWKNDNPPQNSYGCGITITHDGRQVLFNPGWIGSAPCIPNKNCNPPMDHKGFCITPFRSAGSLPAMTWNENVDAYGTSVNWCPSEYRFGEYYDVDFNQWYFTNNNDYVIGLLRGDLSPVNGLWMVHWRTNTWTLLSPRTQRITAAAPAAFMYTGTSVLSGKTGFPGKAFPSENDPNDPHYQVLAPGLGDVFRVGDSLEVRVRSTRNAVSTLSLYFGRLHCMLPGLERGIDPMVDSIFRFAIPDSVDLSIGPDQMSRYSLVSDTCRIIIRDYGAGDYYSASSGVFRIRSKGASARSPMVSIGNGAIPMGWAILAQQPGNSLRVAPSVSTIVAYDCRGRKVWEWRKDESGSVAVIRLPFLVRYYLQRQDK